MTEQTTDASQGDVSKDVSQDSGNSENNIESLKDSKQPEVFSKEYVQQLRRESATYRNEVKNVRAELHSTIIRSELKTAALAAGIVDLDALKMFDTSKLSISAENDVVGVNELVEQMRKEKPYLFKQESDSKKSDEKQESKTDTKKQTSTSAHAKAPETAAAKQKTAMDMSKEEFDKLRQNGFRELNNLA